MTPNEAASIVRFGRGYAGPSTEQRRYIAAGVVLAEEVARLANELDRVNDDYHAQLEAVHDLTETLAEERVQHAAQVERIRGELAATAARITAWDDALGAVVPELEREMAPERPRLVGP